MDYRMKNVILLLIVFLQGSKCLECPDCMHIGYKFTNMPSLYESMMVSLLDSLQLENPACKANVTAPSYCGASGFGAVSKCVSVVVTVNAQGMKNLAPEAGMQIEVIQRGCTSRLRTEPDSCNHISDLGDAQAKMMQAVQRLTRQFNSVNYDGQVCYTSGRNGGFRNPTTRSWYRPSAGSSITWQRVTTDKNVSSADRVNICKVTLFVWILFVLKSVH